MLRILAFSDLHGDGFVAAVDLARVHRPDWIVFCGDMLPDFTSMQPSHRLQAQEAFWAEHREAFAAPGTAFTAIKGNHELEGFRYEETGQVPEPLRNRVVRLEGIPGDPGPYAVLAGWPEGALQAELDRQLKSGLDPLVYLAHAPPYGCLDETARGERVGHRPLFRHLHARRWPPVLVLCGHVHRAFGTERLGETTVINLATGYALVELRLSHFTIKELGRLVRGGNCFDSP